MENRLKSAKYYVRVIGLHISHYASWWKWWSRRRRQQQHQPNRWTTKQMLFSLAKKTVVGFPQVTSPRAKRRHSFSQPVSQSKKTGLTDTESTVISDVSNINTTAVYNNTTTTANITSTTNTNNTVIVSHEFVCRRLAAVHWEERLPACPCVCAFAFQKTTCICIIWKEVSKHSIPIWMGLSLSTSSQWMQSN